LDTDLINNSTQGKRKDMNMNNLILKTALVIRMKELQTNLKNDLHPLLNNIEGNRIQLASVEMAYKPKQAISDLFDKYRDNDTRVWYKLTNYCLVVHISVNKTVDGLTDFFEDSFHCGEINNQIFHVYSWFNSPENQFTPLTDITDIIEKKKELDTLVSQVIQLKANLEPYLNLF
jgi:hypothetical protein